MWGTSFIEVGYKRYAPELTVHRTFLATYDDNRSVQTKRQFHSPCIPRHALSELFTLNPIPILLLLSLYPLH
jgi:hypothetical protein